MFLAVRRFLRLRFGRFGVFEVQEAQGRQTVAELLGNVDVVVPQLEVGMFFDAADVKFVLQRFVEPHFGMASGNFVIDEGVEIFDVFGSPSADEFAVFVLSPANAQTGGNGLVVGHAYLVELFRP